MLSVLASRPFYLSEAWRLVIGYISQSRPYFSHTLTAHEGVAPLRVTRLSMVKPSGATACIWSCGFELAFAPLSVLASCTPYFVSTRKIIIVVRFCCYYYSVVYLSQLRPTYMPRAYPPNIEIISIIRHFYFEVLTSCLATYPTCCRYVAQILLSDILSIDL